MKKRILFTVLLLSAMLCTSLAWGGTLAVRPPICRDRFYPGDPETALKTVRGLFDAVSPPAPDVKLLACIAPSDPWEYSGEVAAAAFKQLKPGQYSRVIILAPTLFSSFEGCSIAGVQAYLTPLGLVPVDQQAVDRLSRSNLITIHKMSSDRHGSSAVHGREYVIEVLLPFLQERLLEFSLVPILVGRLNDAQGKYNQNIIDVLAETILRVCDEKTLIVVSTNFTHYGNDFSYRPFTENIIPNINYLDRAAFDCILDRNSTAFETYLEETRNTIPGKLCIHMLMKMLPADCRGMLMEYKISGAETGDLKRSISYASLCFYEPGKAALPGREVVNPLYPDTESLTQKENAAEQLEPAAPAPEPETEAAPAQEETPTHE